MSIKQLGGVFGRNPTFNDVTIEGQLTFDGDIDINSDLKIDGDLEVIGAVDINGTGLLGTFGDGSFNQSAYLGFQNDRAYFGYDSSQNAIVQSTANKGIVFEVNDNTYGSGSRALHIKSNTDVEVTAGNLVIGTSGKGIDFSATSDGPGTIVSELLDDYEEGYYTATTTTGSGSVTTSYDRLNYTKVGRSCTVSGEIVVSSVSSPGSNLTVSLPFAAASGSERSQRTHFYVFFGNLTGSPTGSASGVITNSGSTTFEVFIYDDFGSVSNPASFLQVGSQIRVGFTYQTA